MRPSEKLARHRGEIREIMKRYPGLRDITVFGSVARGDDTEKSDIDFMVELVSGAAWNDMYRLRDDLEELLGVPVDVISTDSRIGKEVKESLLNGDYHVKSGSPAMKTQRMRKYLGDIDTSARRILARLEGESCESFIDPGNEDSRDIVARHFSIIGEAAAKFSNKFGYFCEAHPEIPFQGAKDLRNKIVHDYDGVDWTRVWQIAKTDLPELLTAIQPYLEVNEEQ